MNHETTDHPLWPYDDENEIRDCFDEADMMWAEHKLKKKYYDNSGENTP